MDNTHPNITIVEVAGADQRQFHEIETKMEGEMIWKDSSIMDAELRAMFAELGRIIADACSGGFVGPVSALISAASSPVNHHLLLLLLPLSAATRSEDECDRRVTPPTRRRPSHTDLRAAHQSKQRDLQSSRG